MDASEMLKTPKLGFGLMRLPQKDEKIDIERVRGMADRFLERGFTYFDTAYVYPGSEEAFREAVAKRHPRESYLLADKMPSWYLEERGGAEALFAEQLARCGVEYFDFYMLHGLQPHRLADYDRFGCWEFCRKMKEEGKIRNFGFSFHSGPETLDKLLTEHPETDFVQLQINYIDWDNNIIHSGANYEVCRSRGVPIIIMEPVKGGILANLKEEAAALYEKIAPGASPASFALRFCGALEGVATILSGMSDESQLEDNMATFTGFRPLSGEELKVVGQVKDSILSVSAVGCTDCRYCRDGCPRDVNIPEIFKCLDQFYAYGEHNRPRFYYAGLLAAGETQRASECASCGRCESVCPQRLEITKLLKEASELLDKEQ